MKISPLFISAALAFPLLANAQGAVDALTLTQPDLRGTARFMSMGGAFGALGGDLTTLSQNPAGIGVYRSHELGFTLALDPQSSSSDSPAGNFSQNNTHFYLNNIGGVLTLKLNSKAVPNLNFGFSYNKTSSFNHTYGGGLGQLKNSMTNYMAGMSNADGVTVGDVTSTDYYDPYNPNDGGYVAPWMSILAYNSYFMNPYEYYDADSKEYKTYWEGQWGGPQYNSNGDMVNDGTSGTGEYSVTERGGVDSYNIALGGNIANVVFWGMDFDISNLNYSRNTYYAENLNNAYVESDQGVEPTTSQWNLKNYYNVWGTCFTYKLGVIVKPIQELRIGFAFHTPTYYSLNQNFGATTGYNYNNEGWQSNQTNDGFPGEYSFRLQSPWRIIVSAAGVIGSKFIISADYEWAQYSKMKFNDPSYYTDYYSDWAWGPVYNSYDVDGTNQRIGEYFKNTNTFRIGAEYRITPSLSVRAGYCNVSSPVQESAQNGKQVIYTAGTQPGYTFPNSTNYVTCGVGYRYKFFYADLAYVYKHTDAVYHAFTDDPSNTSIPSPQAKLGLTSNLVVLSMGVKF